METQVIGLKPSNAITNGITNRISRRSEPNDYFLRIKPLPLRASGTETIYLRARLKLAEDKLLPILLAKRFISR